MAGINKVIIVGRLIEDPSTNHLQNGTAVANFTVATSEEWKDKNTGEKRGRSEFHRIAAWNRLGEICGKYLSKGRQVYVEGKLQTRSWEQDGAKRYSTEIVAIEVQFLDSKGDGGPPKQQPSPQGPAYNSPPEPGHGIDGDIPF